MNEGCIQFDFFLGKSIEDLLALDCMNIQDNGFFNDALKSIKLSGLKMNGDFLDVFINSIQVSLNEHEEIDTISMHTATIIDITFYNNFLKMYGHENKVFKIDKLIFESKSNGRNEFGQELTKRNYSMKEVSFEDKPDYVFWNKENHKIQIRFDYNLGFTSILFKNLNKNI